jgi:hypothetical protein
MMTFLRIAAIAAAFAVGPIASASAATVQPAYLSADIGTVSNGGDGSALWQFGEIWDGRPWGDRLHGHSTVRMTGGTTCDTVAPGSECLFATIRYFNAVNLGAGTGVPDTASATLTHEGLGLAVTLSMTIDRTRNRGCSSRYGCPDQFTVAFTSPMDGFRVVGNGAWVEEDRSHRVRIYWTRPVAPPPDDVSPVPLPASGVLLAGAVAAGLAAARRRRG